MSSACANGLIAIGYIAFIVIIWPLGNLFTRLVIHRSGSETSQRRIQECSKHANPQSLQESGGPDELKAGRLIGALERTLILTGLVFNKWEVVLAVIALKTVARHNDLNHKIAAEYFLIGSLASIVWAIAASIALVWFDGNFGWDLLPAGFFSTETQPT